MNYELQTAPAEPLYVVAVFENPVDAANPLRTELVVEVGAKQFTVQSPAIKVITNGKNYEVLLKLYADKNHTQLLGTHKQSLLFNVPPESKATLEKQLNIQIR
jgi:hypothetical protein